VKRLCTYNFFILENFHFFITLQELQAAMPFSVSSHNRFVHSAPQKATVMPNQSQCQSVRCNRRATIPTTSNAPAFKMAMNPGLKTT
jgi:hypothetical protein